PAQAHDHCSLNLVLEVVRVHNRPALESGHSPKHFDNSGFAVDGHFRAGREVGTFFCAGGDAKPVTVGGFRLPQPKAFAAASRTARKRESRKFLSRNSSGSIFTA